MKKRFGELCPNIAVNAGIQKLKTKTNKLKCSNDKIVKYWKEVNASQKLI